MEEDISTPGPEVERRMSINSGNTCTPAYLAQTLIEGTVQVVYGHLRRGTLKGFNFNGQWYIEIEEAERFRIDWNNAKLAKVKRADTDPVPKPVTAMQVTIQRVDALCARVDALCAELDRKFAEYDAERAAAGR